MPCIIIIAKKMFIDCVNLKLTKLMDMHAFVSIMVAFFFTYPGIVKVETPGVAYYDLHF